MKEIKNNNIVDEKLSVNCTVIEHDDRKAPVCTDLFISSGVVCPKLY